MFTVSVILPCMSMVYIEGGCFLGGLWSFTQLSLIDPGACSCFRFLKFHRGSGAGALTGK